MRRTRRIAVALAITGVSLRRLGRDRLGLFFILVLPFLIILLFGGGARSGTAADVAVGVLGGGDGPLAAELAAALEAAEGLDVTSFGELGELEESVRRGRQDAGLVIPASFDELVASGQTAEVELLAAPAGLPEGSQGAIGAAFADLDARLTTAQVAAETIGIDFAEALASTQELDVPGVSVEAVTVGEADTGAGPSAAGNLVLFIFITSLVGGSWLVESRRLGVSRRMLAAPTTAGAVLAGEALGRFTLAIGQGLLVIFGAAWLFGVDWRDPLALAAVVGLFSLCGTGAAMLFGATFNRPEQAGAVAPPLGIALGMLGGCLWPLEIVPPFMRVVGHAIPHGWAMDAVTAVVAEGAGLADVATELAVLAGFAAALLTVAAWQLRRALTR
jgi:ABC-2 type transport system permease protein